MRYLLHKSRYGYGALNGKILTMQLNPLDFVQCFGSEIAFTTMRATDNRNILNHQ